MRVYRDAHEVAIVFLGKMLSLFNDIGGIQHVSRCKVDCHVGIHVTFFLFASTHKGGLHVRQRLPQHNSQTFVTSV